MSADLPWTSSAEDGWRAAIAPGLRDGRLVAEASEREIQAIEVPLPEHLDPGLRASLNAVGVNTLYAHQLAALRSVETAHTIVTSGTASGKSLAFNMPVLDAIARDPAARALYLYPTKALAQDQARKLAELAPPGLLQAIYDGDTPREERPPIRRRNNLILSNPDMLHVGILPHHKRWGDFFANLRFVVVDEAHVYRGVFGSHVANVLRRLRRIAAIYGSEPRFILTSATIANPGELAERLVGAPFEVVDSDGAPHASRRIAIWNPPLLDKAAGVRRSVLSEAAELLAELVTAGTRTIVFLRSRRGVELIQRFAEIRLKDQGREDLAERIAPYRAGYTPQQRREIEAKLSGGELLAVVATDALELGIDIGELDAAICVTFPGTVASLRQMWGRAGRRRDGIAVYMAGEDGLDQFFCRHPGEFLTRPVEAAILDPANERIQSGHLIAAAFEAPLGQPRDDEFLGEGWRERADALIGAGHLRRGHGGKLSPRDPGFVAGRIGLRSASADAVTIVDVDSGELLGTVEAERAFSTVHPGAVYLHGGRSFEVRELDVEGRRAIVRPFDGDWYTQPKKETDIYIERIGAQRAALGAELNFGTISVTEQVIAFQRKRLGDHEAIDFVALDLPEQSFATQALWYVLPAELAGPAALPPEALLGALHASEHLQIAVLPLLAMCDRWDIGGLSTNVHYQTGKPTIFIYDGYPGGVGISKRGYDEFERLVGDAARLVGECPCEDGCPSCVQSPKCGNLNDHLHKGGAVELMTQMLKRGAVHAAALLVVAAAAFAAVTPSRAVAGPPPIVAFDQGAAREDAIVRAPDFRIEVLTPTLIRLEFAEDGSFENRPTMTAIDRRLPVPRFETARRDGKLTIETEVLTLSYELGSGPFGPENLTLTRSIDGDAETVNPDPAANPPSLGGWRRSLDLVGGEVPLHPGLLSRDGWHVLDDSSTVLLVPGEPGFAVRPQREGAYQDLYLFAYGRDYARGLSDLRALTGPAPLLERKTFGVWFSRYWPYSGQEFREIADRFHREQVPLDTISLDTDFKAVGDPVGSAIAAVVAGQEGMPFSWNGWEWNTDLFPDPAGFVEWAHSEGIGLALNVHPSINSRDPRFGEAQARAGGALEPDDGCRVIQADTQGLCHVFDWTDPNQLAAYFQLHEPFEEQGIDAWWLDWCCDPSYADSPGLTPDTFINWRYAERSRARGSRWPAFQRIGGSYQLGFGGDVGLGAFAEHRQTLQFTGDTCGSWDLLRFASEFTAAEGSIGMPYVSHDIGTFHSVSPIGVCDGAASPPLTPRLNSVPPDMYARWIQLGAFQPLLRLHSSHGERLPWEYGGRAGNVAADFLRLREALIPYIYTVAREAHDTGLPIARALWLSWPELDEAYEERFAHEYTLGNDILVSPVVEPGDPAAATVWLPPGKWIDFFSGRRLKGPKVLELEVPLERMPIFVRGGAILPAQPYAKTTPEGSAKELILTAYHGARRGRTTIYDDAGDGLGYLAGESGRVTVRQRRVGRGMAFLIGGERGRFAEMPRRRRYELRVVGVRGEPTQVKVGERVLRRQAWDYAAAKRTVVVKLGLRSTARQTKVAIVLPRHGR